MHLEDDSPHISFANVNECVVESGWTHAYTMVAQRLRAAMFFYLKRSEGAIRVSSASPFGEPLSTHAPGLNSPLLMRGADSAGRKIKKMSKRE